MRMRAPAVQKRRRLPMRRRTEILWSIPSVISRTTIQIWWICCSRRAISRIWARWRIPLLRPQTQTQKCRTWRQCRRLRMRGRTRTTGKRKSAAKRRKKMSQMPGMRLLQRRKRAWSRESATHCLVRRKRRRRHQRTPGNYSRKV